MDKYEPYERTNSNSRLMSRRGSISLEQLTTTTNKGDEKMTGERNRESSTSALKQLPLKQRRLSMDPVTTRQMLALNRSEREREREQRTTQVPLNLSNAIQLVLDQCSPSSLLEKYFAKESKWSKLSTSMGISQCLSNVMQQRPKILSSVLEILCEKHSKEFLDHAMQENLSSVVCDRLNYESILDYITIKSKMDHNCCNALLRQIPEILEHRSVTPPSNDMDQSLQTDVVVPDDNNSHFRFIQNLLERTNLSDDEVFQLIGTLVLRRQRNVENTSN